MVRSDVKESAGYFGGVLVVFLGIAVIRSLFFNGEQWSHYVLPAILLAAAATLVQALLARRARMRRSGDQPPPSR